MAMNVKDGTLTPKGHQQLADGDMATAASLTVPQNARVAIIQAELGGVRWRDDGTDPTASVGMNLLKDDSFLYIGRLEALSFIEEDSGVGAILNVAYYA